MKGELRRYGFLPKTEFAMICEISQLNAPKSIVDLILRNIRAANRRKARAKILQIIDSINQEIGFVVLK